MDISIGAAILIVGLLWLIPILRVIPVAIAIGLVIWYLKQPADCPPFFCNLH